MLKIEFEEFGLQMGAIGTAGSFTGHFLVSPTSLDVSSIFLEVWNASQREWLEYELPTTHPLWLLMAAELFYANEGRIAEELRDWRHTSSERRADIRYDLAKH